MKYEFSAPMPYTTHDIDKISDINNFVCKSTITSLYGCLPSTCNLFTGFEQARNYNFNNTSFEYWKHLIEYSMFKGFDFIYLLNSTFPLKINNSELKIQIEKLDKLLIELSKINVTKLRVASQQLMIYLRENYPNFKIFASTSLEYKTIWEYQNFLYFHREVKQIVPSHDINKNFLLLKNLKKNNPNVEIELMVNEGCLQGCHNRNLHESCNYSNDSLYNNNILWNTGIYCTSICRKIVYQFPIQSLVIGTNIFPWQIDEYQKIGINKFKLVGRDGYIENFQYYYNSFKAYLRGIDNIQNIKEMPLSAFAHHLNDNSILAQLTVKDYLKYLPKIEKFKKEGHLCVSRCAINCRYCYKCAEKIQKVFEKKMREREKLPHYVPACTIKSLPPSPKPST